MRHKKPWYFTGFRTAVAYPVLDSKEFKVRVWVDGLSNADPDRPVLSDITPDEAETLAAELQARASEARKRTAKWDID